MINVSDFNITGRPIPQSVADKIVEHHLIDLWQVEAVCPFEIWVSQRSGYRPEWYELKKGRDGNSQHVFRMKGAVDLTCEDFEDNLEAFLEALIKYTSYTRFAIYRTFIHCDHRSHVNEERWVYNSNWERLRQV